MGSLVKGTVKYMNTVLY